MQNTLDVQNSKFYTTLTQVVQSDYFVSNCKTTLWSVKFQVEKRYYERELFISGVINDQIVQWQLYDDQRGRKRSWPI
jgi:hypothetical protein